jgi:hypothetical protein
LFFLFVRFLPAVSAFEVRELLHHLGQRLTGEGAAGSQPNNANGPSPDSHAIIRARPGAMLHGMMAEYSNPELLMSSARAARYAGFQHMDAYTPFPVEGMSEALGFTRTRMPRFAMIGAIIGGGGAYLLQWYASVQSYPINVGGRPLHSWPSFVPITFELAILGASVVMILGMILCNRFPRLHHPLFDVPGFDRASTDRFFLVIETRDPRFDLSAIEAMFRDSGAIRIIEIPDATAIDAKESTVEAAAATH